MKTAKNDAKKATKSSKPSKSAPKTPSKRLTVDELKDVKAGLECTFGDKTGCST